MAATRRSTSTRPPAKARATPLPKGSRIPHPALLIWIVRGACIGALALFLASPSILAWAAVNRPVATAADQHDGLLTGLLPLPRPTATPIDAGRGTTGCDRARDRVRVDRHPQAANRRGPGLARHPGRMPDAGRGAAGDLGDVAAASQHATHPDHLSAGAGDHAWRERDIRAYDWRIHTEWRSVLSGAPAGHPTWHAARTLFGTAPWVAFTLTGVPDTPVAMGVVVADRQESRRAETVAAIRAILQGQLPGAQVDAVPDPLLTALTPGVTVAWREYGLKLPPQFPLRFLDDITGSDLLGPFVSALAPHGTLRTEAQIIVRPANRWVLNWGWRGHATALLLNLQAKADYALTEDAKTIEAKLDAAPFEVTLRTVVAAEGANAQLRLDMALNQIADVLGQYHQRTSHHLQTLVQIGAGQVQIADHTRSGSHTVHTVVHTRAPRFAPPPELLLPMRTWRIERYPDLDRAGRLLASTHRRSGQPDPLAALHDHPAAAACLHCA